MSTLEPVKPEPGYFTRWMRQSFGLMIRNPIGLVLFVVLSVVTSAASLLVGAALEPHNYDSLTVTSAQIISGIGILFGATMVTKTLFYADTKTYLTIQEALPTFFTTARITFIVAIAFFAVTLYIIGDGFITYERILSYSERAQQAGLKDLIVLSLFQFGEGSSIFLVGLAWSSPVMIPVMMGLGLDRQTLKIFTRKIHKVASKEIFNIYAFMLVFMSLLAEIPGVNILSFYWLVIFLYVAGREISGGGRENGKETSQETNAVPQTG